ncbi:hypothetical protein FACS1894211_10170 [Clostridia bacterium]|nr:hypothetical protein FACS1894211_10170 [Clostridia bacterium]
MYYAETIDFLKQQGLIAPDGEAAACMDYSVSGAVWGGAIGAAVSASHANNYIIAADGNAIRVFDIDKQSGVYQNTFSEIKRENIKRLGVSGLFGSKIVVIKTLNAGALSFSVPAKFKGFKQKEAVARLAALLKAQYGKKKA